MAMFRTSDMPDPAGKKLIVAGARFSHFATAWYTSRGT
jgi:hypothetical protein